MDPDPYRNSAMNMFRLRALVTLINLGHVYQLYMQAIDILIWARFRFMYLLTDPDNTRLLQLTDLYRREFGKEMLVSFDIEHPGLRKLHELRCYQDNILRLLGRLKELEKKSAEEYQKYFEEDDDQGSK